MQLRIAHPAWLAGWLLIWAAPAQAASGDADGTYTVTITRLEASTNGGTTYTTIFSGSQAVNIASVSAGATVAGLASGVSLEAGTYNTIRVTLDSSLLLRGYVNNGGTTIFTNGGTDGAGFSTNTNAANTPGSTYAISTFTIPEASRTATITGLSITLVKDANTTVTVKFDTSGVLTQTGGVPSVGAPSVSVTSS